jgi:uncharacterized membrane protein
MQLVHNSQFVVTFTQPVFLLLLLLIPLSIWIAWPRLFNHRRKRGAPLAATQRSGINMRSLSALIVRSALLGTVILALSGMQAVRLSNKLAVAFLIDASDSVGANGRENAEDWVRNAMASMRTNGDDLAGIVVFGADAQVERTLSAVRDLAPFGAQVRTGGSNLESAIRLGLSLLPADAARRLVLLSDGAQTAGDASAAARLARATGAQLDIVALPSAQGPDAAVERIDVPQRASVGQTIPLQIVLRSNVAQRAQLTVFAGPDVVAQENINLVVGQNEFNVRASAGRAGLSAFRVQIAPENDTRAQNNLLAASVVVGGPPRVLLVRASTTAIDETGPLIAALKSADINVEEVTARGMPSEIQSLASYQSIVMVNVPARELSQRTMRSIQSYVRDIGGGLVAIGGPNSFGVGGYFKTPLEETLPVEMQVKDPRRFPSVSIVVVMDKSGSMSANENGVLKMRLAAEAAARVAELVNDEDEVTVIGFDTEPVDLIGPFAGRDRSNYLQEILAIAPGGGGIYVYESLLEAQKVLQKSSKRSKFVILLADGSDAERQEGVRDLVRRMNEQENTTLTVVSIGDGTDVPFLKQTANVGKGRFHLTDKAANLPSIFTEETALAQRNYIVEQPFFPKQSSETPILSGIAEVPQLLGYVASTSKPSAQVLLRANASDPLLASWQYGLGRAVAFTSDATGRWGKQWVTWDAFPKFWAQAVRWTILERGQSDIQARVEQRGEQTVIVAELPESRNTAGLKLNAALIDGNGQARAFTLTQVAPGRYEAETTLEQAGAYFVRVRPEVTATLESGVAAPDPLTEATVAYVKPYSAEYAPRPGGGAAALRELADLGGGQILTEPDSAFVLNAPVATARVDLFPFLLTLAALLLPIDVGVRRATVSLRKLLGRAHTEPKLQPAMANRGSIRNRPIARAAGPAHTSGTAPAAPPSGPIIVPAPKRSTGTVQQQTSTPATPAMPATPSAPAPAPAPAAKNAPPKGGSTASELLKRKKTPPT